MQNFVSGREIVIAGLVCLLLGGCVSDDPKKGGFVGGLTGLLSGSYEEGSEARRQRLENLKVLNRNLEAETGNLKSDLAAKERRRKTLSSEVAALSSSTRQLEAEAARVKAAGIPLSQELMAAEARRNQLMRDIDDVRRRVEQNKLSEMEAQNRLKALQDEFDTLLPIYRSMR